MTLATTLEYSLIGTIAAAKIGKAPQATAGRHCTRDGDQAISGTYPHGVAAVLAGGTTGSARSVREATCGGGGDEWRRGPRRAERADGGGGEEARGGDGSAEWERRGGQWSHGGKGPGSRAWTLFFLATRRHW